MYPSHVVQSRVERNLILLLENITKYCRFIIICGLVIFVDSWAKRSANEFKTTTNSVTGFVDMLCGVFPSDKIFLLNLYGNRTWFKGLQMNINLTSYHILYFIFISLNKVFDCLNTFKISIENTFIKLYTLAATHTTKQVNIIYVLTIQNLIS